MNRSRGCPVCVCRGCRTQVSHPGRNQQKTTTTLKRHSESCQALKDYWRNHNSGTPSTINQFFQTGNIKGKSKPGITSDIVRREVLQFFVFGNIPFSQVDNPHFQRLIEWITSSNRLLSPITISRKTIRADLSQQAQVAKIDLKSTLAEIDSKISLALDCWTSRNGFAFLGTSVQSSHHFSFIQYHADFQL